MNVTEQGHMFHCDCGFSWRRGHSGAHDCEKGLRAQRDELLAALELAVEQMESDAVGIEYECGCGRSLEELDRLGQLPEAILEARAAIARAKGGAA